jgi:hypothetical protein
VRSSSIFRSTFASSAEMAFRTSLSVRSAMASVYRARPRRLPGAVKFENVRRSYRPSSRERHRARRARPRSRRAARPREAHGVGLRERERIGTTLQRNPGHADA